MKHKTRMLNIKRHLHSLAHMHTHTHTARVPEYYTFGQQTGRRNVLKLRLHVHRTSDKAKRLKGNNFNMINYVSTQTAAFPGLKQQSSPNQPANPSRILCDCWGTLC